uniref:Uncharacterized protein n=1 Tax=Glossina austeni TaxID=7395 RepID=A0A1A9VBJ2_GLOAU
MNSRKLLSDINDGCTNPTNELLLASARIKANFKLIIRTISFISRYKVFSPFFTLTSVIMLVTEFMLHYVRRTSKMFLYKDRFAYLTAIECINVMNWHTFTLISLLLTYTIDAMARPYIFLQILQAFGNILLNLLLIRLKK